MRSWKNKDGAEWVIDITIGSVKRVRDLAKIDLLNIDVEDENKKTVMQRMASDVELLADVIWCLSAPQAEAKGITQEQFFHAMGGDATDAAIRAFYEELEAFFQSLRRTHLAKALKTQLEIVDLASVKIGLKLDQVDVERLTAAADRVDVEALMRNVETGGGSSTSLPLLPGSERPNG